MQRLKELIPILKLGTTKDNYPYYTNLVNSKGDKLQTCSSDVFVSVDCKAPFVGKVNLYILDSTLKNCKDPQIIQKDDTLVVNDVDYSSIIYTTTLKMPDIEKPDISFVTITEEFLNDLKLAFKYTGSKEYENVYVGNKLIVATNIQRTFLAHTDIEDTFGLSKNILPALADGVQIGESNKSIVVSFDGGYIIYTGYIMDKYPIDKISKFVDDCKNTHKKLCNVANIIDAIPKLSPIFFGETYSFVEITNKNLKMKIKASSTLNGTSEVVYGSFIEDEICIPKINLSYFKDIPFDYNLYVDPNISNKEVQKLYLTNGRNSIILMGGN